MRTGKVHFLQMNIMTIRFYFFFLGCQKGFLDVASFICGSIHKAENTDSQPCPASAEPFSEL